MSEWSYHAPKTDWKKAFKSLRERILQKIELGELPDYTEPLSRWAEHDIEDVYPAFFPGDVLPADKFTCRWVTECDKCHMDAVGRHGESIHDAWQTMVGRGWVVLDNGEIRCPYDAPEDPTNGQCIYHTRDSKCKCGCPVIKNEF